MVFGVVASLFAVMAIAIVAFTVATRRFYTLDTLALLPEETVRFDDATARWSSLPYQHAVIQGFFFQRCVARLTDRRLVVAVPGLFQPSKKVVVAILYHSSDAIPEEGGGTDIGSGSLMRVRLDESRVETMKGERVLKLVTDENELRNSPFPPVYTLIKSARLDDYLAALGISPEPRPFVQ
ncbi:MAG: hypothetical protein U0235_09565 [Polyangiaceae bacterium]